MAAALGHGSFKTTAEGYAQRDAVGLWASSVATLPDGAHGVDDIFCGQQIAGGDLGAPSRAATQRSAFGEQIGFSSVVELVRGRVAQLVEQARDLVASDRRRSTAALGCWLRVALGPIQTNPAQHRGTADGEPSADGRRAQGLVPVSDGDDVGLEGAEGRHRCGAACHHAFEPLSSTTDAVVAGDAEND